MLWQICREEGTNFAGQDRHAHFLVARRQRLLRINLHELARRFEVFNDPILAVSVETSDGRCDNGLVVVSTSRDLAPLHHTIDQRLLGAVQIENTGEVREVWVLLPEHALIFRQRKVVEQHDRRCEPLVRAAEAQPLQRRLHHVEHDVVRHHFAVVHRSAHLRRARVLRPHWSGRRLPQQLADRDVVDWLKLLYQSRRVC